MSSQDVEMRKDYVIEFMKLGMDFDTACIAAEVDEELKKLLIDDTEFQLRKRYAIAKTEAELLDRLNKAAKISSSKGDTKSTERILEILRPDRYSKKATIQTTIGDGTNDKGEVTEFVVKFKKPSSPCEENEPDLVSEQGD